MFVLAATSSIHPALVVVVVVAAALVVVADVVAALVVVADVVAAVVVADVERPGVVARGDVEGIVGIATLERGGRLFK